MFTSECLGVNEKGNLTIGGADVAELAQEYGTPLYIMDENEIRKNCRIYKDAMDKHYGGNGLILYASKAFCCKRMCEIVKEEGLGLDIVSGGELYTAIAAGFPTEKIYFHGNNKTRHEIELALTNRVGRFVVDNRTELDNINRIAGELGCKAKISFRIKPGVEAHTHEFVMTGQIDSKFGVALETGEADEVYGYATKLPNVEVVGVHCHIGSQIFDIAPFLLAADKMMNFISDVKKKYGIEIEELNLGGGYGIKYLMEDTPVEYDKYIEKVSEVVKTCADALEVKVPKILMEPGRSIVGPAGITAYTVGSVKEIPNVRTYVSVDGGMADNPRHIMYESAYEALMVERPQAEPTQTVTVAGKCCESGDVLVRDAKMPEIKAGDLLAVLATGAYNYSMASNYNRIPRLPVVMVKDGKPYVAVRRESYEDLIRNDL